MLGPDVAVVQATRFLNRQFDDLLGARRETDLAAYRLLPPADDELYGRPDFTELDAQVVEDLGGYAIALADKSQEKVLGADVVVVETLRFLLRER